MRKAVIALIVAAAPLSALQAMKVDLFLQKADRLEKKGMAALLSSDFRILKREVETATGALRAERLAAERAGRRGAYCPPKKAGLRATRSSPIFAPFRWPSAPASR